MRLRIMWAILCGVDKTDEQTDMALQDYCDLQDVGKQVDKFVPVDSQAK